MPFNAVIQQNNLYAKSKKHIIYTSKYTEKSSYLYKMDEKDLSKKYLKT